MENRNSIKRIYQILGLKKMKVYINLIIYSLTLFNFDYLFKNYLFIH